jgi:diadenosine tetraphosphate (Ap4A) HIT family hydrolase
VVAFPDAYPVSPGHTLVVPRRHAPTFFDTSPDEQTALFAAVIEIRRALDAALHPDGYNVGFNAGLVAGQTVMHAHLHVIPRYAGDVADPRGGVRGVIPSRQNYGP